MIEHGFPGMSARKPEGELRRGWTTGACATAAAAASCTALVTGGFPDRVEITLPRGERPVFDIVDPMLTPEFARCAVIKDAGDDPDVTHGAHVTVSLSPAQSGDGIVFRAGDGVGIVTKPGLPVAVGEPAINPVPRRMIAEAVSGIAARYGVAADFIVTVSVPGGSDLARKTWNPRLGIEGGLSILGTTGVVVPFSCSAWIHSIHRGIDVARATGLAHIAGSTGNMSEDAVRKRFALSEQSLIDMGDFAGGMLKYLRGHPVPRVTIAGGFAKLVKLAQGHLDLHSSRSQVDFAALAALVARLDGEGPHIARIRQANTAAEVLTLTDPSALAAAIARQAREVALATLGAGSGVDVLDVMVVDRAGGVLAHEGYPARIEGQGP